MDKTRVSLPVGMIQDIINRLLPDGMIYLEHQHSISQLLSQMEIFIGSTGQLNLMDIKLVCGGFK